MARLWAPVVAFPALWLLAVVLAQIHILGIQRTWSARAWLVILITPVAFVGGGLLARWLVQRRVRLRTALQPITRAPRRVLLVLLLIGYAELLREFVALGRVPLLSAHVDLARTTLSAGPLELFTAGLTVCAVIGFATPPRLLSRQAIPELSLGTLGLIGFLLQGGREAVAIPIVAAIIARTLYRRPVSVRWLLLMALAGVAAFSLIFYLRIGQDFGQPFAHELYRKVIPGTPAIFIPFLPADFALALNQSVLAKVVDAFPHLYPYGHGLYDSWALHAILPSRNLDVVTGALTPPWVVSTVSGPFWADGGFAWVVVGCAVTGAITSAPYWLARRTLRFSHALLGGYLGAIALYGVYMNVLTQIKDWVFVGVLLLVVGRWMEMEAPTAAAAARARARATVQADRREPIGDGGHSRPGARRLPIGHLPAIAAVAVVIVLGLADGLIANHDTNRYKNSLDSFKLPAVQQLDLHAVPGGLLSGALATDPSPGGSSTLWAFSTGSGQLYVTPVALRGDSLTPLGRQHLGAAPSLPSLDFGIASWGPHKQPAAFEAAEDGSKIRIRILALGTRPPRLLAVLTTPPIPLTRGASRQAVVVAGPGSTPDLYVLERGGGKLPTILRIYSGASGFQRLVANEQLPLSGLSTRYFNVAFGSLQSAGPDLLILTRTQPTRSGYMEVHVLRADQGYRQLGEQAPIALRSSQTQHVRFEMIHVHGVPALYGIDALDDRVVLLSFTPLPNQPPPR